ETGRWTACITSNSASFTLHRSDLRHEIPTRFSLSTFCYRNHELLRGVSVGELDDFHVDETRRFSRRHHLGLGDLGDAFRTDHPDRAVRHERFAELAQPLQIIAMIRGEEDDVARLAKTCRDVEVAEERGIERADDRDLLPAFDAELVDDGLRIADLLRPFLRVAAEVNAQRATVPLQRQDAVRRADVLRVLERD